MSEQDFIQEGETLLKSIAKSLVDDHGSIRVSVASGGQTITSVFSISCDKSDLGKLIGKGGRTAQAMRTILNAVAAKYNRRAVLDIDE